MLFLVWATLLANLSFAQTVYTPHVSADHVSVEMVSEFPSVNEESTRWVGFQFLIEKDWHLYWNNPGDSGQAPRVRWQLPSWIEAGEIQWPAPSRIPYGPLVNYGYNDSLLLMVPLKVGRAIEKIDSVSLLADVKWLVCKDSCIPGKAYLSVKLPVSATPSAPDPAAAPLFEKTRKLLPQPLPDSWKVSAEQEAGQFKLFVKVDRAVQGALPGAVPLPPSSSLSSSSYQNAFFFPFASNQIENAAPQKVIQADSGFGLELKKSDQLIGTPASLGGVLEVDGKAFEVSPQIRAESAESASLTFSTFLVSIFTAFLGGLILNVMPCVFPVLSLKAIHLLEQLAKKTGNPSRHGWVYTAGVLISFWILAAAMLIVRSGGESLGWGFQLQSPAFVAVLSGLLFLMAIQLLGVFEFGSSFMGIGSKAAAQENYTGSFVTGILATVVATPCTAPFMGTAMAYAMNQPAWVVWSIFTSLGLGLAAPFCLLSLVPSLGRVLPRPGRWMETFKQAMAFPLLATVIWLTWVYGMQAGVDGVARLLSGFLFLGIGAWFLGRWSSGWARGVAVICILIALGFSIASENQAADQNSFSNSGNSGNSGAPGREATGLWQTFSRAKIAELTHAGKPVFIDFTAAWCVTCQVNERVAFTSAVMQDIQQRGVTLMRADWTRGDPEITKTLAEYGRNGVPLYVLLSGKGDAPQILPQILTPQVVLDALKGLK